MSLLDNVTKKPELRPPRIVVHGKGGVGKTTFGASALAPVVLPVEEGLGILKVPHFAKPTAYAEIMQVIQELAQDKHEYKTLVVDTVDHVQPLIWDEVCRRRSNSKRTYENIVDFTYQEGYMFADPLWIDFFQGLDALRRKGMTMIVLCHNEGKVVDDALIGPYERVQPKLHKRANAFLYEWADVVGYLDIERSAKEKEGTKGRVTRTSATTGRRILYLEDQGGFVAKNRFDLPPRVYVPKDAPFQALRVEIAKAMGLAPASDKKEEAA